MGMYLAVEVATNRILRGEGRTENDPQPLPRNGQVYYAWEGKLSFAEPTPTSVLEWHGEPVWVETASLADLVLRAIDQIDSAADAARLAVIAKQTNTPEYQRAEAQARAFKAADYPTGDVPRNVAGWAAAKWRNEWTAQQAADDIIATADRWYDLLDDIRDLRLAAKEDARHATGADELTGRAEQFATDLSNLMKGLA